jgi:hypothetical protein
MIRFLLGIPAEITQHRVHKTEPEFPGSGARETDEARERFQAMITPSALRMKTPSVLGLALMGLALAC